MDLNSTDQVVYFGTSDCGDFLTKQLDRMNVSHILYVTGRESYCRSGAAELIAEALKSRVSFRVSDFSVNPAVEELEAGLVCFREFKPDAIVAIGGGSVLDMAKLINFFGVTLLDPQKYVLQAPPDVDRNLLPMIAIPTTAGTGSEATRFSVLYKEKTKYSVEQSCMLPDVVILNPELTESMSAYQTACCGFDAFSQAIESFWAVGSTEKSREDSARAIFLCMNHLEEAVLNPTAAHRVGMMEAAFFAGKAINVAKTTAAHALSYTLTSHYGLPHGHAVAMMFPVLFRLNADARKELNDPRGEDFIDARMTELCSMLDCSSPDEASLFFQQLVLRIGLDRTWVGALELNVDEICSCIIEHANIKRMANNPRKFMRCDLQEIISFIR